MSRLELHLELHYLQLVLNNKFYEHRILNNKIQYKRLKLNNGSYFQKYPRYPADEETRKQFWKNLGETVTELHIRCYDSYAPVKKYLPNLKQLKIIDIRRELTSEWMTENLVGIEDIGYYVGTFGFDRIISIDIDVDKQFAKILELFRGEKSSLKTLTFNCGFLLEAESVNEVFSWVNFNYLEMDDVIFDYSPLPSVTEKVTKILVRKIKIEVNRELKRVVIKPISIALRCAMVYKVGISESVKELELLQEFCFDCLIMAFKNFPNITSLTLGLNSCIYTKNFPHWPQFPQVTHLSGYFIKASKEQFDFFLKSFPKLTSLKVILRRTITADDCLEIVSKNLKDLTLLNISCELSQITASGLTLLETHTSFKNMEKLVISSSEIRSNISFKKIFQFMPKLEVLLFNQGATQRDHIDFEEEEENTSQINAEKRQEGFLDSNLEQNINVNDLPPEILEQIFSYLVPTSDHLTCRQVCQLWFKILSNSTRCDRTLNLSQTYLSSDSSPVKLFMNTKFQYNKIIFNEKTTFNRQETFDEFWKKIGFHVQNICLLCHDYALDPYHAIRSFDINYFPMLTKLSLNLYYNVNDILASLNSTPSFKSILERIKILRIDYEKSWTGTPKIEFDFELPELEEIQIVPNDYFPFCISNNIYPNLTRMFISMIINANFKLLFDSKVSFEKLKVLAIVRHEKWTLADAELIINHCPNLQSLGLGYNNNDFDDIFFGIECKSIANVLFEHLTELRDFDVGLIQKNVYNYNVKLTLTGYVRKGISTFEKKKTRIKIFDFICIGLNII